MACGRADEVQRYYDAELAPAEREQVEAHFRECPECRRIMRELVGLSSLLRTAAKTTEARSTVREELLVELRKGSRGIRERNLIRLAGWLTAAAAAILIGALVTGWQRGEEFVSLPEFWQVRMVAPSIESGDVLVAQWMADDLSTSERQ